MDNLSLKSQSSLKIISNEVDFLKNINGWIRFAEAGLAYFSNKSKAHQNKGELQLSQNTESDAFKEIETKNLILLSIEEALSKELRSLAGENSSLISEYRKIDQDLTFKVLFDDIYKAGQEPSLKLYKAIKDKIQFLRSAHISEQITQEYEDTLIEQKILVVSKLGGESENIADHQRFACYQLSRAKSFYGFLKYIYYSNKDFFKINQDLIFEIAQKSAWTEQGELNRALKDFKPHTPVLKTESSMSETYRKYVDELEKIKTDIQNHSFNAPSPFDRSPEGKRKIEEHYSVHLDLITKRDVTLDIMVNQRKELSTTAKIKESIKDYASENLLDSKAAAKEFGKALAINAGKRLGKAILNELNGKSSDNSWDDLSKDLALDFIEAGIMGAATFLLGPIGGTVGASLASFIRPQTDPYMDQFNLIGSKIDKGFQKTYEKLDALDSRIKDLKLTIESGLKLILSSLDAKIQHNLDIDKIKSDIETSRRLIFSIESLYVISESHQSVDLKDLLELDIKINSSIQEIIGAFYNSEYSIYNSVHRPAQDKYLPLASGSLANKIFLYSAHTTDGRFITFDETVRQIQCMAEMIRLLISAYIEKREQLVNTIAASAVFRAHQKSSEEFLSKVIDLVYWRDSYVAEYFAVGYQLDKLILGKNILTLYSNLCRYRSTPERFNLLSGFALSTVVKNGKEESKKPYRFLAAKEQLLKRSPHSAWLVVDDKQSKGTYTTAPFVCNGFEESSEEDYIYRYYLVPSIRNVNTYQLISFQNGDLPISLEVQVTLEAPDTLKLNYGKDFSKTQSARVHDLHSLIFENSLEQFLLGKNAIEVDLGAKDPSNVTFSTPEKSIKCRFKVVIDPAVAEGEDGRRFAAVFDDLSVADSKYTNHKILFNLDKLSSFDSKIKVTGSSIDDGKSANLNIRIDAIINSENRFISEFGFGKFSNETRLSFVSPYLADFVSERYGAVSCITLRRLKNVVPSGFKSTNFKRDSLCVAVNNVYFLHLERRYHTDPSVMLRGYNVEPKSLFKTYTPKNTNDHTIYLQENDGHLLIYEGRNSSHSQYEGVAISATGFYDKEKNAGSFLVLTNSGHLLQFSKVGSFLHELPFYSDPSYSYEYDDKTKTYLTNRLLPGEELSEGKSIISTNKQYVFQQLKMTWTGGIVIRRLTDDIYRNHSSKRCLQYFDHHQKFADSADRHRIAMQKDGNLVVYAYKKGGLLSSSREEAVYASGTNGREGVFLMISDDGTLGIWDKGGEGCIAVIKQSDM